MTIKNIKDTIICLGLDQYAFLSINNIDRGPRRISVIESDIQKNCIIIQSPCIFYIVL